MSTSGAHLSLLSSLPSEDGVRLLAFAHDLASLRELGGVTAMVKRAARDLMRADGVTFVLREGEQVFYADEDAIGPLWQGRRFPAEACISGWAILNRQSVIIPDIYDDPRVPLTAYRPTFVKSLLMVPIGIADPVGALGAYWAAEHRADERERALLEAIAGFTAVAVANARLYQEAREAVRARDEWLAVASHELKTPLTPLELRLQHMARRLQKEEPSRDGVMLQVQRMSRSVRRLTRLVDQLLDYSRFSTSDVVIHPETFDLAALAGEVCDVFRQDPALATGALDLVAPSPVVGCWDKVLLEEVLMNLVSNAFKYGGDRPIRVEVSAHDGVARVQVADMGPGISPEDQERIFQAFARLQPNHQGVGLGLWIVRRILHAHGGTITVESHPGLGTKMTAFVPLPRPAPELRRVT